MYHPLLSISAIKAKVSRLSRLVASASRVYPTTFTVDITKMFYPNPQSIFANTLPGVDEDAYSLRSSVLYRNVHCPCPRLLTLDAEYLIVTKLEDDVMPTVTEGTFVQIWSTELECELICTDTCAERFYGLPSLIFRGVGQLPLCPEGIVCDCCEVAAVPAVTAVPAVPAVP